MVNNSSQSKKNIYLLVIFSLIVTIAIYFLYTRSGNIMYYKVTAPAPLPLSEFELSLKNCPVSDGFDFPIGPPNARKYYNAQGFANKKHHLGEDWNGLGGGNTDLGDPVFSSANGIVVYSENAGGGWGNIIRIVHNINTLEKPIYIETFYAHLKNRILKVKDKVKRGQKIATIGNVNGLYYAHLHFEIRNKINMPIGPGYSSSQTGYLNPTQFVMEHRPTTYCFPNNSIAFINWSNVNLRKLPSTNSKIIMRLPKNLSIRIISQGKYKRLGAMGVNLWYKVDAKGKIGWVYGAYIKH